MYAIINISGKQYKVLEGSRIRVPKQNEEKGSTLIFKDISMISDGKTKKIFHIIGNTNYPIKTKS